MSPRDDAATWSKIERASRMAPSALCAMIASACRWALIPSLFATCSRWSVMSAMVIRLKS